MATLNLSGYSNLTLGKSVLGYSAGKDEWTVTGTALAGYTDVQKTIASVAGGTAGLDFTGDTIVTSVNTGSNYAWSIAGSATMTEIETGSKADSVTIGTTSETDVRISVGEGADYVSVQTAAGKLTVQAGDGADSVVVGEAKDNLSVELGNGKDSLTIGAVAGDVTITGNDANYVSLKSATGTVSIELGDGNDTVAITSVVSGTINVGTGKDSVVLGGLNAATLTAGDGNKEITVSSASDATIGLGAGDDKVKVTSATNTTIALGDGNDVVTLSSLGNSTVTAGAGKDSVLVSAATDTSIDLGEGNDYISLGGAVAGTSVASGDGKDIISVDAGITGTVTLTDFDLTNDVLQVGGVTSLGSAELGMLTSDGQISLSSSAAVQMNDLGGYYAANVSVTGGTQIVAWAGENGATIDASSLSEKVIITGTTNGEAVDTLIGGSKNDTIVAGAGDYVYGGAGSDSIILKGSTTAEYVGLTSNGGKDTVASFQAVGDSSNSDGDVVYLFENSISDAKLSASSNDLIAKVGTAQLTLTGVLSSNEGKIRIQDNSGSDYTVDYVGNNGLASIAGSDSMANIYYSGSKTNTTLDFSSFDDALVVDLGNSGVAGSNTGNAIYYGSFASVKGGSDKTILVGAAGTSESLAAGSGDTTIWGGGSKADLMQGTSKTDDGVVTFVYGAGDGKDTIENATWGSADTSDVLWLNNADIKSVKKDSTGTVVTLNSDGDKLTLKGATDGNQVLKVTTNGSDITQVKIGLSGKSNTWTYEEGVSVYMGGTNNTLKVGSDVDTANIWLDGSQNVSYDSVKVVDASSNSGTLVIAGTGSANESLVAGKGETSMWGGSGESNDTLKGAANGATTFFFGNGDGKDVITNSYSDDKVVLYNVALSDIADLDTSKSGVMKITLNDGSSLTINSMSSSSVSTFQLGDGSTWSYNYSKKTWTEA